MKHVDATVVVRPLPVVSNPVVVADRLTKPETSF